MSAPKISVMVSLFNSAAYLRACARSLQRQTFSEFEALLADGGSTDATPQLAKTIVAEDTRFRWIPSDRFKLVSESRQQMLEQCRGEYVAILDSDDIALPARFARQASWLDAHRETVLVATNYRVISKRGWPLRLSAVPFESDIDLRWRSTFGNCLTQSTLMFRRDAALGCGGYDLRVRSSEDMEFYTRLLSAGRFDILRDVLNLWRWHSKSLSKTEPLERKSDLAWIVQQGISRQAGENVSLEVASALFNQSTAPADSALTFRQSVEVTERAVHRFLPRLFDPAPERTRLYRAAFLQLLDLFSKNAREAWWPDVMPVWLAAARRIGADSYRWNRDAGLLGYYRKLLKTNWRWVIPLLRAAA